MRPSSRPTTTSTAFAAGMTSRLWWPGWVTQAVFTATDNSERVPGAIYKRASRRPRTTLRLRRIGSGAFVPI